MGARWTGRLGRAAAAAAGVLFLGVGAVAQVTNGAAVTRAPSSGPAGTVIVASSGPSPCPPPGPGSFGRAALLGQGGQPFAQTQFPVSASGQWSTNLTVPPAPPGQYQVAAQCWLQGSGSPYYVYGFQPFTLTAAATTAPATVAPTPSTVGSAPTATAPAVTAPAVGAPAVTAPLVTAPASGHHGGGGSTGLVAALVVAGLLAIATATFLLIRRKRDDDLGVLTDCGPEPADPCADLKTAMDKAEKEKAAAEDKANAARAAAAADERQLKGLLNGLAGSPFPTVDDLQNYVDELAAYVAELQALEGQLEADAAAGGVWSGSPGGAHKAMGPTPKAARPAKHARTTEHGGKLLKLPDATRQQASRSRSRAGGMTPRELLDEADMVATAAGMAANALAADQAVLDAITTAQNNFDTATAAFKEARKEADKADAAVDAAKAKWEKCREANGAAFDAAHAAWMECMKQTQAAPVATPVGGGGSAAGGGGGGGSRHEPALTGPPVLLNTGGGKPPRKADGTAVEVAPDLPPGTTHSLPGPPSFPIPEGGGVPPHEPTYSEEREFQLREGMRGRAEDRDRKVDEPQLTVEVNGQQTGSLVVDEPFTVVLDLPPGQGDPPATVEVTVSCGDATVTLVLTLDSATTRGWRYKAEDLTLKEGGHLPATTSVLTNLWRDWTHGAMSGITTSDGATVTISGHGATTEVRAYDTPRKRVIGENKKFIGAVAAFCRKFLEETASLPDTPALRAQRDMAKTKLRMAEDALAQLTGSTDELLTMTQSSELVQLLQSDLGRWGGDPRAALMEAYQTASNKAKDLRDRGFEEGVRDIAVTGYQLALSTTIAAPIWTLVFGQTMTGDAATGSDQVDAAINLAVQAAVVAGLIWLRRPIRGTVRRPPVPVQPPGEGGATTIIERAPGGTTILPPGEQGGTTIIEHAPGGTTIMPPFEPGQPPVPEPPAVEPADAPTRVAGPDAPPTPPPPGPVDPNGVWIIPQEGRPVWLGVGSPPPEGPPTGSGSLPGAGQPPAAGAGATPAAPPGFWIVPQEGEPFWFGLGAPPPFMP